LLVLLTMNWFLSRFRMIGAVLITLVGILLAKVMALDRTRRMLETSFSRFLPSKNLGGILLAAMIAAILPACLNARLDFPGWVLLPISGMAYMATYSALVVLFRLLGEDEIAAIKRAVSFCKTRSLQYLVGHRINDNV